MARRRNYGFERRQKEAIRQARQDAKRERKAERSDSGEVGPEMGEALDTSAPPGQWEWFSPSRGRVLHTSPEQKPPGAVFDDWGRLTVVKMEGAGGGSASAIRLDGARASGRHWHRGCKSLPSPDPPGSGRGGEP